MNKSLMTVLLFMAVVFRSYACEICGCSTSNFQIGLLPNFNKGFMSVRYTASSFHSQVRDQTSEYSRDYYKTMELWGGYNIKKLQVMAFAPYLFTRKESDDGVTTLNGIGDMLLLANYKILSATTLTHNEKSSMRNELFAGGGIKLPTGVNRVNPQDPDFNIGDFNSQAGTGSIDYMLTLTHNMMWNNSGIVTNVAYRINTANQQQYKFGNRAYVNSSFYHTLTSGDTKIRPNAGINFQVNGINYLEGAEVEDSNGFTLNSTLGVNVLRKTIGMNAMVAIPITQNMYDGQTKLQSQFLLGVTYSF